MTTRSKWKMRTKHHTGAEHKFFAASAVSCTVSTNLESVIRRMKARGWPFNVWMSPIGAEPDAWSEYLLVDDTELTWLGYYEPATKKP